MCMLSHSGFPIQVEAQARVADCSRRRPFERVERMCFIILRVRNASTDRGNRLSALSRSVKLGVSVMDN
jgi:hypothetical protein